MELCEGATRAGGRCHSFCRFNVRNTLAAREDVGMDSDSGE